MKPLAFLGTIAGKAVAFALILILLFFVFEVRSCQLAKQRAAQAKVDQGQAAAFQNSATDAISTQGNVASNEAAGVEIGRQSEEEIRHAKGSDVRVDPAANAAGLRALCRRASHANDPACRVQQPHSR